MSEPQQQQQQQQMQTARENIAPEQRQQTLDFYRSMRVATQLELELELELPALTGGGGGCEEPQLGAERITLIKREDMRHGFTQRLFFTWSGLSRFCLRICCAYESIKLSSFKAAHLSCRFYCNFVLRQRRHAPRPAPLAKLCLVVVIV